MDSRGKLSCNVCRLFLLRCYLGLNGRVGASARGLPCSCDGGGEEGEKGRNKSELIRLKVCVLVLLC